MAPPRPVRTRQRHGGLELRPIVLGARFRFDELGYQLPIAAVEKVRDRLALRLKAEAGSALPIGRNPQI